MKLTILETSDIHANIYPTNYFEDVEQPYGLLKVASLIENEKAKAEGEVVIIDNGDFIQGTPLGHHASRNLNDPSALVAGLNAMGYDAGVLGNHEYNFGLDYLKRAIDAVDFPILSANITNEIGECFADKPYIILNKGDLKIGILGLTTQYIPHWEVEPNIEGLTFQSAVEMAKLWAPKIKEEADILIVSYHGGIERDLVSGEASEPLSGENEGYQLVIDIPEIDVLLTGHQHRKIATTINGKPVVQPGYRGEYVAKVTLEIDDATKKVISATPELLKTNDYPEHQGIEKLYQPIGTELDKWLNTVIGRTDKRMAITDTIQARVEEHPYVEFVNKMQLEISGADISATALFTDNQPGFEEEIRVIDVMVNYGYPNTLAVIEVTGSELKAAMEKSSVFFDLTEDNQIVAVYENSDVKPQPYLYDMYEGIDYVIDISQEVGQRVVKLEFNGKPVEENDTFKLVTNQYRANGGGNYDMFYGKPFVAEWHDPISEQMTEYIKELGYLDTEVNHNFKVIVSDLIEN